MDKIVKYELKLSIPSSQASQHLKKFENFLYKAINQGQGMKQTDVVSITSTTSYSADVSFTLSSGSGVKFVYVWFKDGKGNIAGYGASITYSSQ